MKICALALSFLLAGCADAHPASFRDTALRLDLEGGGICSGTAVGKDIVLTAEHCTNSGPILAINGLPARALKIIKDGHDHVLVRVTMRFKHWAQVGRGPNTGDRVRWLGMPAANDRVYREGYVSRVYLQEIWVDGHSFGGDSGAAMFGNDGRIVGVVSAGKMWINGPFTFSMVVLYPLSFTAKDWKEIA
jgi:hypothetical protein